MVFENELNHKIAIVDKWLCRYMTAPANAPDAIYDAMNYSVSAGGKRVRPVIMMATYELFCHNIDNIMPFACAIEMIHTSSLIHDDLPAMDNSALRRGRPTNHIVYGEAMAVLAGDGLLTLAFETMLDAKNIQADTILKAAAYVGKCTGNSGMIGGQVMDISFEGKQIPFDTLKELHSKKTGALINASAVAGAIVGGADSSQQAAVEQFATYLGLAFQIKDDILDVTGDAEALGKPVGSDIQNNKNTYVSLFGVDNAQAMLIECSQKAIDALTSLDKKSDFLLSLAWNLQKRDR